jgi:hypothetical protein
MASVSAYSNDGLLEECIYFFQNSTFDALSTVIGAVCRLWLKFLSGFGVYTFFSFDMSKTEEASKRDLCYDSSISQYMPGGHSVSISTQIVYAATWEKFRRIVMKI